MGQDLGAFQSKVLKVLQGKMDNFYLAGGSALSLYYFHHRMSLDLDFFTREFSQKRVVELVKFLSTSLKRKIKLMAQQLKKDKVRILVYSLPITKRQNLKIDFVEDYLKFIKPLKLVNGIKVLSLEDIYLRKLYAIAGTVEAQDTIGRKISQGSRQEAKDFFDLYCLSHTFMRLSDFSFKYCSRVTREVIIRWFRTYSRLDMKIGFLELELKKAVDYPEIEHHFKREINKLIEKEVGFV